ncbi:molybdate ABC transporter substrate-binding protein [Desulfitobacterium hafniense]|uniref:Molybdenum ABC transporter, substrate-binding protein n=1 Tax=Desulfitobacterium hafniense TaxID=49338 RepID=A0A098AUC7_DESHA|nr:molybdate ABC transporter substrate-binding protein [Desulfitobacterium hafniense]CDW99913.1 Molybdenum ABC transporter, substrate-binding protein [Desulfitobacterium hafniense]
MFKTILSKLPRSLMIVLLTITLITGIVLTGCSQNTESKEDTTAQNSEHNTTQKSLLIYAGSASKPPTEEAAKLFEQKTGVKVDLVFGGSGTVLSQMKLNKKGDLYFPGSSDFMEKAKQEGLVYPETEAKIVYLVNAINVQKGNPKGIKELKDLLQPGLKVAIANPETVCVGLYATEIIDNNFTPEEKQAFKKNLINYTESCDKTATAISLKTVDAVIGWRVFHYWDPEKIETIPLRKDQIARIGYIPIAISAFTQNKELSQQFIDFLNSEEGKASFKKYNYFVTPEEAEAYIGVDKPVGGEYKLQEDWIKK